MIYIVAAIDRNNVIGFKNSLPWHIPEDLKYFKKLTTGKHILMGRKTYDSIGKPLPNRMNIVMTRNRGKLIRGCMMMYNIVQAHAHSMHDDIYIIGGSEIYRRFLPVAEKLYLTEIDHSFIGDSYFPEFDRSEWELASSTKGIKNQDNPFDYYFNTYIKNKNKKV